MRDLVLVAGYYGQRLIWWLVAHLPVFGNRGSKLRDLVANTGIVVFVGPNGSGKSLIAVDSALDVLDGESWSCLAIEHQHNAEFLAHAAFCPDCEERTLDRAKRCRRGRFLEVIGSHGIARHVRRCSRCEVVPGEFGGRCDEGLEILSRTGHGERLVYSTVALLGADGTYHPRFRPVTDYRQLVMIEHADVLFDEVAGISDAADSASTPGILVRWLQQLRKRDVRLRVTTPDYDRCSKPIRQVAQLVVDARSFFPEPGTAGRRWRSRRAMIYRAYDGFSFLHFTPNAGQTLPVLAQRYFWRPGCRAQERYDTLAQVLALADVTETGMCTACGGTRSRPRCSCPGSIDDAYIAGADLEVVETVSASGSRVRRAVPVGGE